MLKIYFSVCKLLCEKQADMIMLNRTKKIVIDGRLRKNGSYFYSYKDMSGFVYCIESIEAMTVLKRHFKVNQHVRRLNFQNFKYIIHQHTSHWSGKIYYLLSSSTILGRQSWVHNLLKSTWTNFSSLNIIEKSIVKLNIKKQLAR